jgi:hypothetical protein
MVFYSRYLPIITFVVGTSALVFQTMVLYPWHNELDAEFKRLKVLKETQDVKLEEYNSKKMDKIHELETRLNHLIDVEEQKLRKNKAAKKV